MKRKRTKTPRSLRSIPSPGGAKSKFTPYIRKVLIDAVAEGQSLDQACALAGISKNTYYRWIAIADGNERPHLNVPIDDYIELRDGIYSAVAENQLRYIRLINQAALDPRNWKAAIYMLDRHRKLWEAPRIDPQNSLEKSIVCLAQAGGLSDEQVAAIYEASQECMQKTLEIISRGKNVKPPETEITNTAE